MTNRMKYFEVDCFWCKAWFSQRQDTVKRQMGKYGHSCCKNCFGKEQTFRDARSRVMIEANPFKGKKHSGETKRRLAVLKIGKSPWNKGLTALIDKRVMANGEQTAIGRLKLMLKGSANPNWKGGISRLRPLFPGKELFQQWLAFADKIKEDFGHRCCKCSKVMLKKQLDIHHLLSQTIYPDQIYNPENCIALCRNCHKQFHEEFGRIGFTPADAITFINRDRSPVNYFITR